MNVFLLNGSPNPKGATAALLSVVREAAEEKGCRCETICLGEMSIRGCLGCKSCYETGACVLQDDAQAVQAAMERADLLVIALPSYWGDMPGQAKIFIDRCTPYCNTNRGHRSFSPGTTGFGLALRAGRSAGECEHLVASVEHFLGHLDIPMADSLFLTQSDTPEDVLSHKEEILARCRRWF